MLRAVRSAFWLGFHLQQHGELARAAGWRARIGRLVPDDNSELSGLLLMADAALLMNTGDPAAGLALFDRCIPLAVDPNTIALGTLGRGNCLGMLGRHAEALTALDEAMVTVTGSGVGPEVAGMAYCSVIDVCLRMYDVRRAQEWTQALTGWCDEQSGLVPYRGVSGASCADPAVARRMVRSGRGCGGRMSPAVSWCGRNRVVPAGRSGTSSRSLRGGGTCLPSGGQRWR